MHNTFNSYLWNCTIDVSDFTSSEEHFIKLREPNIAEFKAIVSIQKLLNDDKAPDYEEKVIDVISQFCDICSTLIVDHNFYDAGKDGEQIKLGAKDIVEFLKSKIDLAQEILSEYMINLPLLKTSNKK